MPDRGKFVGAICLGALAYILSELIKFQAETEVNFGLLTQVNMVVGIIVGWKILGKGAGSGVVPAINNGLTGLVSMIVLSLCVHGANEMLRLAMRQRYDNAFEAILSIATIGFDFVLQISTIEFWSVAIAGGILAGLIVEVVWQRWR